MEHSKNRWAPLIVIVAFAILAVIVNPFRELLTQDDGWAYARSVKHLLATGEYHLDSWAAANMPVQIYFAAGLARIFGYSLSLLRISTLLLFICGALAFYRLLYESGADGKVAAALSIALICSPIVLILGFTFMTDVQFLGWLLISCWLYARGLRQGSVAFLFLGSLAAALAIGTRQFGIALPAGLISSYLIVKHPSRPVARDIVAGVALPLIAFFWQLWTASSHPTFTQSVRLVEQMQFIHPLTMSLLPYLLWRSTVLVEYAGLYLAALIPGLLLLAFWDKRPQASRRSDALSSQSPVSATSVFICGAFLLVGLILGFTQATGVVLARFKASLVPTIPWIIGFLVPDRLRYEVVLTMLGVISATLLAGFAMKGLVSSGRQNAVNGFLAGTMSAFAVLHLFYVQLNDTYLIVFVPFALFAISCRLCEKTAYSGYVLLISLCSMALGISVALWMRADYNKQEAVWNASEQIRSTGVDPMQIRGSLHWVEYHSAFDRWLAELGPTARPEDYAGPYRLHNPFYKWIMDQQKGAKFVVYPSVDFPRAEGYGVVERVPYRDLLFRRRYVYIMTKTSETQPRPR